VSGAVNIVRGEIDREVRGEDGDPENDGPR
jgi:hypothetical protein